MSTLPITDVFTTGWLSRSCIAESVLKENEDN